MGKVRRDRQSKLRATSKRTKSKLRRRRKYDAHNTRVSEADTDRADDHPRDTIVGLGDALRDNEQSAVMRVATLAGQYESAEALVGERQSTQAADDEAFDSRPTLRAPARFEAPETTIRKETGIDDVAASPQRETRAGHSEAPEISIRGETEIDGDDDALREQDVPTSAQRGQQTDVSSVSAFVLKPRAQVEHNASDLEASAAEPASPASPPGRRLGWVVVGVAFVVGWWLVPVVRSPAQHNPAAQDTVIRTASVPASKPAERARATAHDVTPGAQHANAVDVNVPHVALETLPIENASDLSTMSTAHGSPAVARPTQLPSRLAAYKMVTLAAARAATCRHRGDGPGPVRVSVDFGSDGQVDDVQVDRSYSGTMTGQCIAAKFRALAPSTSIKERTTTAVDVQLY